jgi:hypothetical protein
MDSVQTMLGMPSVRAPGQRTTIPIPSIKALLRDAEVCRRMEIGKKIRLVKGMAEVQPRGGEEVRRLNSAIKWLKDNYVMMDREERAEALRAVRKAAVAGVMHVDPVEAGHAMRVLGIGELGIKEFFWMAVETMRLDEVFGAEKPSAAYYIRIAEKVGIEEELIWNAGKPVSYYYGVLAAAMGDKRMLRIALFHARLAEEADANTAKGRLLKALYGSIIPHLGKLRKCQAEAVRELEEEQTRARAAGNF